jgi:hypothetical protein
VCGGGGEGGHLCTVHLAMGYSFQLARNDRVNLRFSLCTILYMQKKVQRDSATRFSTSGLFLVSLIMVAICHRYR